MFRRIAATATLAVIFAAPATSNAQSCQSMAGNLIQNCSFELGVVLPGADYPNAVVSNWNVTFAPQGGSFERWTNSFDGFAARDGNSHLELQVNGPTNIAQSFLTTAGQSYAFGFSAAHRPRDWNGFSQIDVYLNNSLLMTTGQITTPYQWSDFSTSFVGTGGSTTLEFRAMGNQLSYGDFLDNVSVVGNTQIDTVVPEPSTFALMGAGFAMVGFIARRKRSQK